MEINLDTFVSIISGLALGTFTMYVCLVFFRVGKTFENRLSEVEALWKSSQATIDDLNLTVDSLTDVIQQKNELLTKASCDYAALDNQLTTLRKLFEREVRDAQDACSEIREARKVMDESMANIDQQLADLEATFENMAYEEEVEEEDDPEDLVMLPDARPPY